MAPEVGLYGAHVTCKRVELFLPEGRTVQCGWYRGFFFEMIRPGMLMAFRDFLLLPGNDMASIQQFWKIRLPHSSSQIRERGVGSMEFITGVKEKETLEISDVLKGDMTGKEIRMNGAVHTIRDMGDVAFVVLRKREGLV